MMQGVSSQLEEEAIKRQVVEFPVYEKQQPIDKVVLLSLLTQSRNHSVPGKTQRSLYYL